MAARYTYEIRGFPFTRYSVLPIFHLEPRRPEVFQLQSRDIQKVALLARNRDARCSSHSSGIHYCGASTDLEIELLHFSLYRKRKRGQPLPSCARSQRNGSGRTENRFFSRGPVRRWFVDCCNDNNRISSRNNNIYRRWDTIASLVAG